MSNLPPAALAARPKTSRMAIASIICPLGGFVVGRVIPTVAVALVQAGSENAGKIGALAGFFAVEAACATGLICGIAALVKIRRSGGRLGGRAAAIIGIVLSAIFLVLPIAGLLIFILNGMM